MLIPCPECAHNISDKALACPNCGYPMVPAPKSSPTSPPIGRPPRRKKKYKKLPNGYGSIKFLGKNRNRPYAAYPPTTEFTLKGSPATVPAIGYFPDWHTAFDALREYNHNPYDLKNSSMTFEDVYKGYYHDKYENPMKEFSRSAKNSAKAAFKNCSALHTKKFKDLRKNDLQEVVDNCKLKHSSLELIINLYHGMYRYAIENDLLDRDYSKFITINIPDDDENGEPFSQEDLNLLWKNKDKPGVDTILIMIYSGFRISAYKTMTINLDEKYFQGGVKTAAGKNRIVPIHPEIFSMVCAYQDKCFYNDTSSYRKDIFYPTLESLGILYTASGTKHTPHDCRHTFSWLCDRYKVDDISKHLLMGHAISGDVESRVYSHRTIEELRAEIAKIKV